MLFAAFVTSLLAATMSIAAPIVAPQELIVFSPRITAPEASVAWPMGSTQVVKWETAGIPHQKVAATGMILLGHMENDSENLDFEHPIATGFPITDGFVHVVVPYGIQERNDYFLVLFGDSGNKSPQFRIHQAY